MGRYGAAASDRRATGKGIAEIVGRHQLLVERREIGRPLRLPDVHHHGAILPDIVVIVGVVAMAMNEALGRALIEVDIVNAVAFAVKTAEDIDIETVLMRL